MEGAHKPFPFVRQQPPSPPPEPPEDGDITPFTSETPKPEEKLDLSWKSFRWPKLGRCPFDLEDLTFHGLLGRGQDGIVFKAQYKDTWIALKVFHHHTRPNHIPYPHMYWPFERECKNATLLEKISKRLQESLETKQPIYLYPDPSSHHDALRNLRAFSDEGRVDDDHPARQGMEPLQLDEGEELHANPCYGWMRLPTPLLHKLFYGFRMLHHGQFYDSDMYYGIAYNYIGHGGGVYLDTDKVVRQMRILHLAGFLLELGLNHNNWRGDATLIDMSDITSPAHSFGWVERHYSKQGEEQGEGEPNYKKWAHQSINKMRSYERPQLSWLNPNEDVLYLHPTMGFPPKLPFKLK
ncbi:hypothetical protein SCUCBS95973_004889 [Sporothrix curviconia]|uniref:Protein kinase domain-containing protein n=1 Tax=Sporothrix curviconia TaxID=1260050 RepID=A0ABP0BSC1_9PEZI